MMEFFPELITPLLRLRRMELADVRSLVLYANNPKISDQILNIPYPYTEEDAIQRFSLVLQGFKKKERFIFAITLQERNELIGEIGLHLDHSNNQAQLGYWVAEPFWGRGIASEATAAVLKFGIEKVGLHKILATHYPANQASARVLQKNGMIREGGLKDHYKVGDEYRTVFQYRLLKPEYVESRRQVAATQASKAERK